MAHPDAVRIALIHAIDAEATEKAIHAIHTN